MLNDKPPLIELPTSEEGTNLEGPSLSPETLLSLESLKVMNALWNLNA